MTRRRSSYRSIASLQRDNRVCRACAEAGYPLESLPIVQPYRGQRAYMFGQAPGIQEGRERLPWRGRAGKTLRRWLELDEDTFYATFYCASVTRCYPGRAPSGRGDRTPTPREQELCAFWRDWELELIRPAADRPRRRARRAPPARREERDASASASATSSTTRSRSRCRTPPAPPVG